MPDLEKAIKGLETCIKYIDQDDCPIGCPYHEICTKYEGRVVFQPVFRDALDLLKEQAAVKPRVTTVEQRCGNCNKVIEMDGWQSCPWCGKRIDWKGWWKKNGTRNQDT